MAWVNHGSRNITLFFYKKRIIRYDVRFTIEYENCSKSTPVRCFKWNNP